MALAVNKIGSETFLYFVGTPRLYRPRVERLAFPGSDGAVFRRVGYESGQFQLRSCKDVLDMSAATAKLNDYKAMIATAIYQLVWRNIDYDAQNLRVAVLDVEPTDVAPVLQWAGAASNTNKAKVEVVWTLEFRKI